MFQDLDSTRPLPRQYPGVSSHTCTQTHNPQSSARLFVSASVSLSFRRDDLFCFSTLRLHSSAGLRVSAELHHPVWIPNPRPGDARANTGE